MPQLDALSWFDQVFTSTIVFFAFYLLLSLLFLPALASIFKGRYKLTSFRSYVAEIFNLQANLFTLNTKNHLSILFFNNIFLVHFYYQPLFTQQLHQNLINSCYTSAQITEEGSEEDTVLSSIFTQSVQLVQINNRVDVVMSSEVMEDLVEEIPDLLDSDLIEDTK
jgi:hypothetical protein